MKAFASNLSFAVKDVYIEWSDTNPMLATVFETVSIVGLRMATEEILRRKGVSIGNGHASKHIQRAEKYLIITGIGSVVVAPVLEELVFRKVLPNVIMNTIDTNENNAEKATLAVFVASHFSPAFKNTIPIPQLVGGAHYTRLHKRRGFKHAVIAHSLNNALYATKYLATKRSE